MRRKIILCISICIILTINTSIVFAGSVSSGKVYTSEEYLGGEVDQVGNGNANGFNSEGWPENWNTTDIKCVEDMEEAPDDGAPGSHFHYFCPSPHEQPNASMYQTIFLRGDYKDLAEEGQLRGRAYFYYSGWDYDNTDECFFEVDAKTSEVQDEIGFGDTTFYVDHTIDSWNTGWKVGKEVNGWDSAYVKDKENRSLFQVPSDTEYLYLYIRGDRKGGSDLDTYFDRITLLLYDFVNPAVDENAWEVYRNGETVNERDWLKIGDKLGIEVTFSEELDIPSNAKLKLNIENGTDVKYAYYKSSSMSNEIINDINHEKTVATFVYTVGDGDKIIDDNNYKTDGVSYITYYSSTTSTTSPFVNIYDKNDNTVNNLSGGAITTNPRVNSLYKQNIRIDSDVPVIMKNNEIDYELYSRNHGEIPIKITQTSGVPQSDLTVEYKYCSYYNNKTVYKQDSIDLTGLSVYIPAVNEDKEINDKCLLKVKAIDGAGNISDELQIIVNQEDKEGPNISLDYPKIEGQEERLEYKQNQSINVTVNDIKNDIKNNEIKYFWSTSNNISEDIWNDTEVVKTLGIIENTSSSIQINNKTGDYYLHIMAEDDIGNSTVKTSELIRVDNAMPKIIFDPVSDTVSNSEKLIGLTILDEHNGEVKKDSIKYQIIRKNEETGEYEEPSGDWNSLNEEDIIENITGGIKEYKYNLNTDVMNSGEYKLLVKAIDGLGNFFNIDGIEYKEYNLTFDTLGPEINLSYNKEEASILKRDQEISFSIGEQYSDVNVILYKWDEGQVLQDEDTYKYYSGDRTIDEDGKVNGLINSYNYDEVLEGQYYLHIKAIDSADNISVSHTDDTFYIDTKQPEVTFGQNGTSQYVPQIESKVTVTDSNGVSEIAYYWGRDIGDQQFIWTIVDISSIVDNSNIESTIKLEDDKENGTWYLNIRAIDSLGNENIIMSNPFYYDTTIPEGTIQFSNNIEYTNKISNELLLTVEDNCSSPDKMLMRFSHDKTNWSEWESFKPSYIFNLNETEGIQKVYVQYKDEAGYTSDIYEANIYLDMTCPTASFDYSNLECTNKNVIANINITDELPVTILNNGGSTAYEFKQNDTFEFIFKDIAGNRGRVTAEVNNIDKDSPRARVEYSASLSEWTNESIYAEVFLEDTNNTTFTSIGGNMHEFNENGSFTFGFEDDLGNKGNIIAEVNNIDKEKPEGTIIYSIAEGEQGSSPVTVFLKTSEPVKILNNEGLHTYIFDENGEFTFEFEDKAGNTGQAIAVVNNINNDFPKFDIYYSTLDWTNQPVNVTYTLSDSNDETYKIIQPSEPLFENEQVYYHTFEENDVYLVTAESTTGASIGMQGTVGGIVYNIDTKEPSAYLLYSTLEWTNEPVTVTLLTDDDNSTKIEKLKNDGKTTYTFYDNGEFAINIKDEAGNIASIPVLVNNIDINSPEATLYYSKTDVTSEPVYVTLELDDESQTRILNNNGENTFEFVENGSFTFYYTDEAGNDGSITAVVNNIVSNAPQGIVEYYLGETKLDESELNKSVNQSITAKIRFDDSLGTCTIINNEGKDFYTFEENGIFTFEYIDELGNQAVAIAYVNNIDKKEPEAEIHLLPEELTTSDVDVTIIFNEPITIEKAVTISEDSEQTIENSFTDYTFTDKKISYTASENNLYRFTVKDEAKNVSNIYINVTNIDREPPIGTIVYSTVEPTNGCVEVYLTANEEITVTNNEGSRNYTFYDNGEFTFYFVDKIGFESSATASVNWVDKDSPIVTINYSNTDITKQPVVVTVSANEDIVVINNSGLAKRTFDKNSRYTFIIEDLAGNQVTKEAIVENIDTKFPEIFLNGNEIYTMVQNETYEECGAIAVDNMDGELTDKIEIDGEVDTTKTGNYIITYSVTDKAGNKTSVLRTVKVIEPMQDGFYVYINGNLVEELNIMIDNSKISMQYYGNQGTVKVKWAQGWYEKGYFKRDGTILENKSINILTNGWYTLYLVDQERNTKLIHVYVNKY